MRIHLSALNAPVTASTPFPRSVLGAFQQPAFLTDIQQWVNRCVSLLNQKLIEAASDGESVHKWICFGFARVGNNKLGDVHLFKEILSIS